MTLAAVSADAIAPHSGFPKPLTSLVGRETVIPAILRRLLEDECRLLTLTGPGGAGKTRLAIAVAAELPHTPAIFVDLSNIRSGDEILPAIAQTIDLDEAQQTDPEEVAAALSERQSLLVLDNLEQIADCALPIRDLLTRSAGLTILATSRVPVRLSGEQRWPVEPLPLAIGADLESARQSPAVILFAARARLVKPDFVVDESNVADVCAICARLDGIPLAIELAAARMAILSPKALMARLEKRLTVLACDALDVPDRQQTMRTTVAWSYDLLAPADQALFSAPVNLCRRLQQRHGRHPSRRHRYRCHRPPDRCQSRRDNHRRPLSHAGIDSAVRPGRG